MKNKKLWLAIAVIAFALLAIVYVTYVRSVDTVTSNIESFRDEVNARGDGSTLEWDTLETDGLTLMATNFHFLDAPNKLEVWASELQGEQRINSRYNFDAYNVKIDTKNGEVFEATSLSLIDFNNAARPEKIEFETADFQDFKWSLDARSSRILEIEQLQMDEFQSLNLHQLSAKNLVWSQSEEEFTTHTPQMLLKDANFKLIGVNQNIGLSSYDNLEVENIIGTWHNEPAIRGHIRSNAKRDTSDQLSSANLNANLEIDVSRETLKQGLSKNPDALKLLESLDLERVQGTVDAVFDLGNDQTFKLKSDAIFEEIGALHLKTNLNNYSSQIFAELKDQTSAPKPQFSRAELVNFELLYEDQNLADHILKEFVKVDPAIASFLLQMTLPEYLPSDPALRKDVGQAVSGFLNGQNSFSINLSPPMPVSFARIDQLIAEKGPYQQNLGIEISGH